MKVDTLVRVCRSLGLGLVVALAACGNGGGVTAPTREPSITDGGASPTGAVVKASPRGCHRTRTGETDIQFSFSLIDHDAVGDYGGDLDFHVVSLTSPSSWTVAGGVPHVIDRPNSGIFHVVVPSGEPIPAELSLHAEAEALDGSKRTFDLRPDALLSVPVGVCNAG